MRVYPGIVRCLLSNDTIAQVERRHVRNTICLVMMSTLLVSPLPALGQSSASSNDRGAPLLALDLKDILPNVRQTRRKRRIPRPRQSPSSPFPRNSQPRQSQPKAPISQQEQQFLDSLSPDEQQFYGVIQKAKNVLRQQTNADALGLMFGMTPKGVTQSPQDLDREFQTILRDSRNASSSATTEKGGNSPAGAKPGNQLIHRLLNKRSHETHEQWHARIDPLVFATPLEEYKAWRATLSSADKQAYDTLAQNQRQKQSEEAGAILRDSIRRDLSCRWVPDPQGDGIEKIRVCDD
jgi:hypothetical protein